MQAVLSPFGWGEVCFRDAEAVIAGAVLVKPLMDHVETWPDIYLPRETYMPVAWDASDVVALTQAILGDSTERQRMCTNAWDELHRAYRQIPEKVECFLDTVCAGN